jgi:hypothetical protein
MSDKYVSGFMEKLDTLESIPIQKKDELDPAIALKEFQALKSFNTGPTQAQTEDNTFDNE